jgi:aryl-alcohol dehydrogenase-like predicted oxidoreductase
VVKYRELGRTSIKVSSVCMGCWSISTKDFFWDQQAREDSLAAVRAALECGVNFFDTAPVYGDGDSEEILGEALGPRRKEVVIATKVRPAHLSPPMIRECCENSLRALRTDYIDLYQVHWPSAELPLEAMYEALLGLQAEGKVRAIGVSNFGTSYLGELLRLGRVESNQVPYSLLWRAVEYEIAPLCIAHDIGILCYSPLCQGLLTGKFASADAVPEKRARSRLFSKARPLTRHGEGGCEEAMMAAVAEIGKIAAELERPMGLVSLAWLLHQPGVTSVVAGARNAAQAAENACAADLDLSADLLQRLSRATDAVKSHVGRNADPWEAVSRMERKR